MADPWTEAWEEAEASAPPGVQIYATLELQHPIFVEGSTPFAIRVVAGSPNDELFTLEPGAILNGGQEVNFQAVPFFAERPQYEEGKTPESMITIDNVARILTPYLEDAVLTRADMTAIYREYRSDDRTEPCYGPVQFLVKNVKVTGTQVTGAARIDDLANRKFPNKVYTINEYPGLQP